MMEINPAYFLSFLFLAMSLLLQACSVTPKAYYISPEGTADAPGTIEKPFASLQAAQTAIRQLKAADNFPSGGVQVFLRQGVYALSQSFTLTAADAGTETSPVKWTAFPNEEAILTGGIRLRDFQPLGNAEARQRIDAALHDKILEIDLSPFNIGDYGDLDPRRGNRMELYVNGAFMQLARYPNEDWLEIASVPQFGKQEYVKERTRIRYGVPVGRHFGRFAYDTDRPNRWADDDNLWMHGYWVWDWSDEFQRIARIDKRQKEIYPAEPYHGYGYHQHQRFYFLNVLEELDQPGEWYLDRKSNMLYFWPPAPLAGSEVWLSLLDQPLIHLDQTAHIQLEGLRFQYSRAEGVQISGGSNNLVGGGTFSNLGKLALVIEGGKGHTVTGCDMYQLAMGGISMKGGERTTLTAAQHTASNNHIHHFAQRVKTYQPAITTGGVGNRIAHNLIHDAPHMAIGFGGNDHLIEYNEVYQVLTETSDAGAVYNGRDWTERGTTIRYNYFHDLGLSVSGEGFHGVMGVYLDDCLPGTLIKGNVFERIDRGIMLGGGQYNIVENNVFIDCDLAIHVDARANGWARKYAVKGGGWNMREKLAAVDYQQPPWSERYPELVNILDHPYPPIGTEIKNNISQGKRWLDMLQGTDFDTIRVISNLVAEPQLVQWQTRENPDGKIYTRDDASFASMLQSAGNVLADPGGRLAAVNEGKLELPPGDLLKQISFEPIPFDKIGLYEDAYRTHAAPNH